MLDCVCNGLNFDLYWVDERGFPYLITVDSKIVGFALVYKHNESRYSIVEFFILKKYRRKDIGASAVLQILDLFQGECEITYSRENESATRFWPKVAQQYSSGRHDIQHVAYGDWQGWVLRIKT